MHILHICGYKRSILSPAILRPAIYGALRSRSVSHFESDRTIYTVEKIGLIILKQPLKGKVQHFSWITDLRVNKGTVYRIMQGARARWRIENETFNTLKNQGYHFEHNFGHGYQHLSVVFATLMMLAFCVDQVQQLCCPLFQAAWAKWGSKRLLWEKMRAYFYAYALASMRHLFETLYYDLHKSAPTLAIDSG